MLPEIFLSDCFQYCLSPSFSEDENLFEESLLLFIPEKHHPATKKVVVESKSLLIRYYIGVILEVIGVMTIITYP